jgi:hypothetical protein
MREATSGGIGILHLVERFSLMDADTLLYQFEVDDPTAFTKPWKGELTMARSSAPIYEYACHEGNYSLPNMLRGYRLASARPPVPALGDSRQMFLRSVLSIM